MLLFRAGVVVSRALTLVAGLRPAAAETPKLSGRISECSWRGGTEHHRRKCGAEKSQHNIRIRGGGTMAHWTFNAAHTAAEFCVRHMMITYVRGHFKNLAGTLEFDASRPEQALMEVAIDVATLWSGESERDDHLRSEDFLDVAQHPTIRFRSTKVEPAARNEYKVIGDLTIRGVTRSVTLDVRYLGQCRSPFDDTRIGFTATTRINRHEFGVSWNADVPDGGVVVGDDVLITVDAEAELVEEGGA